MEKRIENKEQNVKTSKTKRALKIRQKEVVRIKFKQKRRKHIGKQYYLD